MSTTFYNLPMHNQTEMDARIDFASIEFGRLIARRIKKLCPNKPVAILDVGTGVGNIVLALRQAGLNAYGIDTRRAFPLNTRYFIQADVKSLPFADHKFDIVMENLLFAHMQDFYCNFSDIDLAFRDIDRVLKPAGLLMVSSMLPIVRRNLVASHYLKLTGSNIYYKSG